MRLDPRNRPVNRPAVVRACNREAWHMGMARSPWLNNPFQASIAAFPYRYPAPSSRPSRANVQSGFDQNIRGRQRKVSLQVSHSRLFEVLALHAPTKFDQIVTLKTARILGLDSRGAARPCRRSEHLQLAGRRNACVLLWHL